MQPIPSSASGFDGRQLVDREQLRDLVTAYCRHIDRGEPAAVAALFTVDGRFASSTGRNGIACGRQQIAARVETLLSTFEATSHHVSNVTFLSLDREGAELETYLFAWHRFPGDRPDGYLWGHYLDRAVRTADGWRLAERTLTVVGEHDFPFGWIPYRS